jgi:predicted transcriptional regulator
LAQFSAPLFGFKSGDSMDAIFSLKPYFAEAILAGTKTVEVRSVAPNKPVERVWMYASAPVMRIVGHFTPSEPSPPNPVHDLFKIYGAEKILGRGPVAGYEVFDPETFYRAIEIRDPVAIEPPINPREMGLNYVWISPQNFRYAGTKESEMLRWIIDERNRS